VLDNYAYLVARAGRQPELEPLVLQWVRSYHTLFKVPVTAAPTFDGKRAVSPAFQRQIDEIIEELLHRFGIEAVRLDPEARADWTNAALRALRLPLTPPQIDLFRGAT
jgi:hypothetical protein